MTISATPDFWKLFKGKKEVLGVGSVSTVRSTWSAKNKIGTVQVLKVLAEDSIQLGNGETKFAITDLGPGRLATKFEWEEPLVGEEVNKANIRLKDGYGLGVTSAIRYEATLSPQARK